MEEVKQDNLFKYSKREDYLNYITHGLGAILALIGTGYLLVSHSDVTRAIKVSVVIYGLSMFALFMASCLYHKEQNGSKRALLKRFDHAMILVMISGTYAPFCMILASPRSYTILALVYILSIIGIILKIKYINVRSSVSISIYLVVGWLAVFMLKDIVAFFDPIVIILMISGGVIYSLGALVYAFTKFEYHHALWHVFVLVAAIAFYVSINFALFL